MRNIATMCSTIIRQRFCHVFLCGWRHSAAAVDKATVSAAKAATKAAKAAAKELAMKEAIQADEARAAEAAAAAAAAAAAKVTTHCLWVHLTPLSACQLMFEFL